MAKAAGKINWIDDPTSDVAISVSHINKSFRLPHNKQSSIKGSLVNLIGGGDRTFETQKVLKDVSFEIKKGEFFGIVGRNGSGKSTLLKMLAGIYKPTSGDITINGSLTPFIELGVGFNPELTGRENVYLNGALLGFNDKQVDTMYGDIVRFAELERFMDQKLKNYSSGMQVRLAFSIAIRARSDILLLDEVLAVGDEAFQRKCFDYFETLRRNKKTVILVTHDMGAVERFCSRAMFVEDGDVKLIGKPHAIAAAYSRSNDAGYHVEEISVEDKQEKHIKKSDIKIRLFNSKNKESTKFTAGERMSVRLEWENSDAKHAGVAIYRQSGEYIFGTNTFEDRLILGNEKSITYYVQLNLAEGTYFIQAGLFGDRAIKTIDFEEQGPIFAVSRDPEEGRWGGMTKLEHSWEA